MKKYVLTALVLVIAQAVSGQFRVEVNGLLDLALSRAGDDSHFFYNGVHRDHTGWRAGPAEANVLARFRFGEDWTLNTRLQFSRREGGRFDRLDAPLLNLEWAPAGGRVSIQLGRFLNPFGLFNPQQLSIDRTFVGLPIPYLYSTRISNAFGGLYYPGGAPGRLTDRPRGWPLHYYGGYQTGLRLDWQLDDDEHWSLAAALTTGAALAPEQLREPLKLGLNARLAWKPGYLWEQGFSFSAGNIMKRTARNADLTDLSRYNQVLAGTDVTLGLGYWQVSGELMAGWQRVPFFNVDQQSFVRETGGNIYDATLFNLGGYLSVRFEPPFLTGSYVAYQFGGLAFGDDPLAAQDRNWDGNAINNQIGFGYKITRWLLLRSSFAWLDVRDTAGDYWSWQSTLTVHF